MNDEIVELQRDLADAKKELAELKVQVGAMFRLLHGDPATMNGGLAQFVNTLGDAVLGSKATGGGLVQDNMQYKKIVWTGIGIMTVLSIGMQVLFHFWKP